MDCYCTHVFSFIVQYNFSFTKIDEYNGFFYITHRKRFVTLIQDQNLTVQFPVGASDVM